MKISREPQNLKFDVKCCEFIAHVDGLDYYHHVAYGSASIVRREKNGRVTSEPVPESLQGKITFDTFTAYLVGERLS